MVLERIPLLHKGHKCIVWCACDCYEKIVVSTSKIAITHMEITYITPKVANYRLDSELQLIVVVLTTIDFDSATLKCSSFLLKHPLYFLLTKMYT